MDLAYIYHLIRVHKMSWLFILDIFLLSALYYYVVLKYVLTVNGQTRQTDGRTDGHTQ